jgi:hypothetical protein
MSRAIDHLTTEYHEHVITSFVNAVLKSGLVISSGTRHRELPKWLREELADSLYKSKCQFLLPYAGFLKDKGFFIDPARMDDRLDVDMMLQHMLGYGHAIVGKLPGEDGYHTTSKARAAEETPIGNVTYVPIDMWRRNAPRKQG